MKKLYAIAAWLLAVSPAWALPVGAPGASLQQDEKKFAVSGGISYLYRQVEGSDFTGQHKLDNQKSFRFELRGEYAALPWLTPTFLLGYGDRSRSITRFDGAMGPLVGAGARIEPLQQHRDKGISITLFPQVSYAKSAGRGLVVRHDWKGDPYTVMDADTATTWQFETSVLVSRKDGRVTIYAGPKFDWERTTYSARNENVDPVLPIGVVVGLDYDVTPEVFFTAEMENFHQDAIHILVGGRF